MILIVDDDKAVCMSLSLLLKQSGRPSDSAHDPDTALQKLASNSYDLVLQDMNFSSRMTTGEEGLALLRRIHAAHPQLPVILMTAWGSISLAVAGIREGARDFITKPWTHEQILTAVRNAHDLAEVGESAAAGLSRTELDQRYDFSALVGQAPKFLEILELVGRIAATDAPVLITGETGTGKELMAEALHINNPRVRHPFIKVNLGGMSTGLFESEMFGHVKGTFTDAKSDRKGRFEAAHRGSIFLDEIGDLDPACQVKLLRVLQDRTYEPLGSSQTRTVDVRVISATNRPLHDMVKTGDFREDLLYRLNLIAIHLPALRERREDIALLADSFLAGIARIYRREDLTISRSARDWLTSLDWPGNIRQLKQMVERTLLMSSQGILEVEDFKRAGEMTGTASETRLPAIGSMTLEQVEKNVIEEALKAHQGNISKVAEALDISRAALYRRIEKFGLTP